MEINKEKKEMGSIVKWKRYQACEQPKSQLQKIMRTSNQKE
jgi:hypothetical protein